MGSKDDDCDTVNLLVDDSGAYVLYTEEQYRRVQQCMITAKESEGVSKSSVASIVRGEEEEKDMVKRGGSSMDGEVGKQRSIVGAVTKVTPSIQENKYYKLPLLEGKELFISNNSTSRQDAK